MAIRGEGLRDEDEEDDAEARANERVSYALHPNCGIFEDE
jgi:hypothetical protein